MNEHINDYVALKEQIKQLTKSMKVKVDNEKKVASFRAEADKLENRSRIVDQHINKSVEQISIKYCIDLDTTKKMILELDNKVYNSLADLVLERWTAELAEKKVSI